jgi:predicted kinase
MRRMPEDRRLSNMLTDPDAVRGQLSALAKTLAAFHSTAERGPAIAAEGTPRCLRERWESLIEPLQSLPADIVDTARIGRIRHLAARYIDGRTALLHSRINAGRIVDGHGDLLAEDIFDLPDGFRVLDCLDFDDRLRYIDVVDDIAFLAMDLEFRGHRDLAERFLLDYLAAAADPAPVSLIDHYIAYRAMVRAKVDVIRLAQGEVTARPRAHHHLDIGLRHLERSRIRLALVGGLPGTGKTTLAKALAAETGAVAISSDTVRGQLRDTGAVTGEIGVFGKGAYNAEAKAAVYREMLARARSFLGQGIPVVMDASWNSATERDHAAEMAAELAADVIEICCECPQSEAARRIRHRRGSDSDATEAIASAMSATQSPWPTATTIDTSSEPSTSTAAALQTWRA